MTSSRMVWQAALKDADALIVRSAVDVNAQVLRSAQKLRVIGRAGVGVDNIDLEAATKAGIAVMNTPGANAVAVAEHTIALMLAMARHLVPCGFNHARRQMGKEITARHGAARQDAGHCGAGTHWDGSGATRTSF